MRQLTYISTGLLCLSWVAAITLWVKLTRTEKTIDSILAQTLHQK